MAKSDNSLILIGVLGAAWLLHSRASALGTAPGVPAAVLGGTGGLNTPAQKENPPPLAGGTAPALETDTSAPSIFTLEQDQFFQKQFWAMPVSTRLSYMGYDEDRLNRDAPLMLERALAAGMPMPEEYKKYPFLFERPAATHPPVGKGPGGGFVYGGSLL